MAKYHGVDSSAVEMRDQSWSYPLTAEGMPATSTVSCNGALSDSAGTFSELCSELIVYDDYDDDGGESGNTVRVVVQVRVGYPEARTATINAAVMDCEGLESWVVEVLDLYGEC